MQPDHTLKPQPERPDPSESLIDCALASCEKKFKVGDSYSFIGGIATTGPSHISPFVCGVAEQHFGCCIEHALLAYILCLRDHVVAVHAVREAEALNTIIKEIEV